eukprot:403351225
MKVKQTYQEMIEYALVTLAERHGSTSQGLWNCVKAQYPEAEQKFFVVRLKKIKDMSNKARDSVNDKADEQASAEGGGDTGTTNVVVEGDKKKDERSSANSHYSAFSALQIIYNKPTKRFKLSPAYKAQLLKAMKTGKKSPAKAKVNKGVMKDPKKLKGKSKKQQKSLSAQNSPVKRVSGKQQTSKSSKDNNKRSKGSKSNKRPVSDTEVLIKGTRGRKKKQVDGANQSKKAKAEDAKREVEKIVKKQLASKKTKEIKESKRKLNEKKTELSKQKANTQAKKSETSVSQDQSGHARNLLDESVKSEKLVKTKKAQKQAEEKAQKLSVKAEKSTSGAVKKRNQVKAENAKEAAGSTKILPKLRSSAPQADVEMNDDTGALSERQNSKSGRGGRNKQQPTQGSGVKDTTISTTANKNIGRSLTPTNKRIEAELANVKRVRGKPHMTVSKTMMSRRFSNTNANPQVQSERTASKKSAASKKDISKKPAGISKQKKQQQQVAKVKK